MENLNLFENGVYIGQIPMEREEGSCTRCKKNGIIVNVFELPTEPGRFHVCDRCLPIDIKSLERRWRTLSGQ